MRKYSWQIAGFILNLALGVAYVKGWANSIPNVWVFILFMASLAPVGYWAFTHERLGPHRDKIRAVFAEHPLRSVCIGLILIVPCTITAILGLRWFYLNKLSAWIAAPSSTQQQTQTTKAALDTKQEAPKSPIRSSTTPAHKTGNPTANNTPNSNAFISGGTIDGLQIKGGVVLGSHPLLSAGTIKNSTISDLIIDASEDEHHGEPLRLLDLEVGKTTYYSRAITWNGPPLFVDSLRVIGDDATEFDLICDSSTVHCLNKGDQIAAGSSWVVTIAAHPKTTGEKHATIWLEFSGPATAHHSEYLEFTARAVSP